MSAWTPKEIGALVAVLTRHHLAHQPFGLRLHVAMDRRRDLKSDGGAAAVPLSSTLLARWTENRLAAENPSRLRMGVLWVVPITKGGTTMKEVLIAASMFAGILLVAGHADAQYQYTDDKGVKKVVQYKLDVPAPHRDSAIWIGPTGAPVKSTPKDSPPVQGGTTIQDLDSRIRSADSQLKALKQIELEKARQQQQQATGASGGTGPEKWRMVGRTTDRDSGRPLAAAADMNFGTYYDRESCQGAITRRLRMEARGAAGSYTVYTCERQ